MAEDGKVSFSDEFDIPSFIKGFEDLYKSYAVVIDKMKAKAGEMSGALQSTKAPSTGAEMKETVQAIENANKLAQSYIKTKEEASKLKDEISKLKEEEAKLAKEQKQAADTEAKRLQAIKNATGEIQTEGRAIGDLVRELRALMKTDTSALSPTQIDALNKKIAVLKNDVKETRQAMKYLDPGEILSGWIKLGQGVVGTFSAVTGAMTLFGVENKNIQEIQKKSMALIQVMMGLEQARQLLIDGGGIKMIKTLWSTTQAHLLETLTIKAKTTATVESTVAENANTAAKSKGGIVTKAITGLTWLWNAALAANPIVAIIVAIGALAVGIYALTRAMNSETEAEKKNRLEKQANLEIQNEVNDKTGESIGKIKALQAVVNDTTLSEKNRIDALKQLKKETGGAVTITDLSTESLKTLNSEIETHISMLQKQAEAEAWVQKYQEGYKKLIDYQTDLTKSTSTGIKGYVLSIGDFFTGLDMKTKIAGQNQKDNIKEQTVLNDIYLEGIKKTMEFQIDGNRGDLKDRSAIINKQKERNANEKHYIESLEQRGDKIMDINKSEEILVKSEKTDIQTMQELNKLERERLNIKRAQISAASDVIAQNAGGAEPGVPSAVAMNDREILSDEMLLDKKAKIEAAKKEMLNEGTAQLIAIWETEAQLKMDAADAALEADQVEIDRHQAKLDRLNEELAIEDEKAKKGIANNKTKIQNEIATEKSLQDIDKKKQELDRQTKQKAFDEKKKATKASLTLDYIQQLAAIALTASGLGLWGIAYGIIMGGLATVAYYQNLQTVNAEKLTFAKGGSVKLKGKRHSEGGISIGNNMEAEDGERLSIFSRDATKRNEKDIMGFTEAVNQNKLNQWYLNKSLNVPVIINNDFKRLQEIQEQTMNEQKKTNEYLYNMGSVISNDGKHIMRPDGSRINYC